MHLYFGIGCVAQSVKAPYSNCKVVSSMRTLRILRCCDLGKDFQCKNANYTGGADQWEKNVIWQKRSPD